MALWTFRDQILTLRDFTENKVGGDKELRMIKRAIFDALRDLARERRWNYYTRFKLIAVNPAYSTGTIQYQQSAGASPLLVTLTGGTFPSWAPLGYIVIKNVPYKVATNPSSTTLNLALSSNPGADVAALTNYKLFQDSYVLPENILSIESVISQPRKYQIRKMHARQFAIHERAYITPGSTAFYCITGDPNYQGRIGLRLGPPSSIADTLEVLFHTAPLQPQIQEVLAGSVTVTSGSNVVTGSGTAWDNSLVGCALRISKDATNTPTGPDDRYQFATERVVIGVASATSLTVDTVYGANAAGMKYVISDILDLDQIVMLDAFKRCCEWKYANALLLPTQTSLQGAYLSELQKAQESDNRTVEWGVAGEVATGRWKYQQPYETGP